MDGGTVLRASDYWETRAKAAEAEVERLKSLLHAAPILLIDRSVADRFGEAEAIQYADAVKRWHPMAKAALSRVQA